LQGHYVVTGSRSNPGSHMAQVVFLYASHVAQLGTVHTPTVESEMHIGVPSLIFREKPGLHWLQRPVLSSQLPQFKGQRRQSKSEVKKFPCEHFLQ
jgi:hypothetical protein